MPGAKDKLRAKGTGAEIVEAGGPDREGGEITAFQS